MSRIFWDTNIFIYLLEEYGMLSQRVRAIRERMIERGDQLLTSTLILGELFVKPTEKGALDVCRFCQQTLANWAMLLPFDAEAATHYARIRCDRSIKAPDAMQLACAGAARVGPFLTNDDRSQSKRVEGIQFLTSLQRAPL